LTEVEKQQDAFNIQLKKFFRNSDISAR